MEARSVYRVVVFLLAVFSFGVGNRRLFDDLDSEYLQKLIVLVLFVSSASMLFFLKEKRRAGKDTSGIILLVSLYLYYLLMTSLYSTDLGDSVFKLIVLTAGVVCAYSLAQGFAVADYMAATQAGLLFTSILSILVAVLVPEIGVVGSYMHETAWSGVFSSKQSLGFSASTLFIISLIFLTERRSMYNIFGLMVSAVCIYFSESRGSAIVASLVVILFLSRKYKPLRAFSRYAIEFTVISTFLFVALFAYSGLDKIVLFGNYFDISNRTVIWEYTLREWKDNIIFGVGFDGYWNDEYITSQFQMINGWVLYNFHSGYVSTLVEAGIVGALLLILMMFRLAGAERRLWALSSENRVIAMADKFLFCATLFFVIANITETYFNRSTSGFQVLYFYLLFSSVLALDQFRKVDPADERLKQLTSVA